MLVKGAGCHGAKPRDRDQAEAIWPHTSHPHPKIQNFTYKKTAVAPLDLTPSSLPARVPASVAAVSAMAEVHLTSASTTGVPPADADGSALISLQNDIDSLKREIDGLKTTVGSLVKEVKDLRQLKVETVGDIFFPFPLVASWHLPLRLCFRSPECSRSAMHHARVV